MREHLEQIDESINEGKLTSLWDRLAPLSVGAVASSILIVSAGGVLKRFLGRRRDILGWASAVALIPVGLWLLSRDDENEEVDDEGADGIQPQLEERKTQQLRES